MAKAKTKTKKPVIDDDEDDILPEPLPPEPAAPLRPVDSGMVLDMEGQGGEVASALVVNGLRAYLSVVNKGVNVIACDRAHTAFIPVKISACSDGLDVRKDEAKLLVDARGVLAFLLDDGEDRLRYFIPVSEYLEMAEDRGEGGLRLDVNEHADWLEKFEGHPGVKRAFQALLGG